MNPETFLHGVFPELQAAVAQFRPYVPWFKRFSFDRVWSKYRNAYGRRIDIECYHHYMGLSDWPGPKGEFHRNVTRLLAYAKQT